SAHRPRPSETRSPARSRSGETPCPRASRVVNTAWPRPAGNGVGLLTMTTGWTGRPLPPSPVPNILLIGALELYPSPQRPCQYDDGSAATLGRAEVTRR